MTQNSVDGRGTAQDKKKKTRKINIKKAVISAVAAVVVIYFGYILIAQQVTINQKSREIEELERQVAEAGEESERLKAEVDNLSDPEYLERVARERLGLVRPNERVFVDSNKSEDKGKN